MYKLVIALSIVLLLSLIHHALAVCLLLGLSVTIYIYESEAQKHIEKIKHLHRMLVDARLNSLKQSAQARAANAVLTGQKKTSS